MVARRGLVVLGLILVAIGGLLLGGTLGLVALDTRRLTDYWPLVFVLIGLVTLLEAWAPGRPSEVRRPAPGTPDLPDADELERRLQERLDGLVASRPTEAPSPAAAEPEQRHAGVVAALLELQGLRRNRLISKQDYRSKRSELLARMSPLPVSQRWADPAAGGEGGMDDAGLTASR